MMKAIQKIMTIMLTLVFFTCASGFMVTIHHCCHGEKIALELVKEACCHCETHNNTQSACCKDEVFFVKIYDSFDKKDTHLHTKIYEQTKLDSFVFQSLNHNILAKGITFCYNSHPLTPLLISKFFVYFAHQQLLYA